MIFNLSFGNSDKGISKHNNSTKKLVTILTNLYILDIIDVLEEEKKRKISMI